jgi:hypothetical protein
MPGRRTCTTCGKKAPESDGARTLTTAYGWRLRRAQSPEGADILEWRCPSCWQKLKTAHGETAASLAPPPPATGRRS